MALLALLLPVLMALAPEPLHAAAAPPANPVPVKLCLDTRQYPGLANLIVNCIKDELKNASKALAAKVKTSLGDAAKVAASLAVLLAGLAVMGGLTPTWDGPIKTMVHVIIVVSVTGSIASNIDVVYGILDELVGIVTVPVGGPCTDPEVWVVMDCQLNRLVGGLLAGSTTTLKNGLIGFLGGSLLSGGLGAFIALMGAVLVVYFIYSMLHAVYIYITAYVALALILMVSPIFVPMILFQPTRHYFESWLNMLFSFVMQPVALFAYLSVMLLAFDQLIFTGPRSLYAFLQVVPWQKTIEQSVGTATVNVNPKESQKVLGGMTGREVGVAGKVAAQTDCAANRNMLATLDCLGTDYMLNKKDVRDARNFFSVEMPVRVVDWGENYSNFGGPKGMIKFTMAFFSAAITAYVLFSLMHHLPYIGAGIAGGGGGVPVFGKGTLSPGNDLIAKQFKSALSGGKG